MAKKANAKQNDAAPAELRKLAVQAVKHKATIDDANFKKRELRETTPPREPAPPDGARRRPLRGASC